VFLILRLHIVSVKYETTDAFNIVFINLFLQCLGSLIFILGHFMRVWYLTAVPNR